MKQTAKRQACADAVSDAAGKVAELSAARLLFSRFLFSGSRNMRGLLIGLSCKICGGLPPMRQQVE